MASTLRVTMTAQIAALFRQKIADGEYRSGDALPPIKEVAERFGVSLTPVNQAFGRLEREGLVQCRVGDGTYVTGVRPISVPSSVVLCTSFSGHIYGQLAEKMLEHLHRLRVYPVILNTNFANSGELFRDAIPHARVILVIGSLECLHDASQGISLKNKRVVGVLSDYEALSGAGAMVGRIVVDHHAAAHMIAEHLWQQGCRRVIVLGTNTMMDDARQALSRSALCGYAFGERWLEMGGHLRLLAASQTIPGSDTQINPDALRSIMCEEATRGPVGIFGLRDFEARQAQDILLSDPDHRFGRIPIIGYGNTPWSQAAHPSISSMDWNLEELAREAGILINSAITSPEPESGCRIVRPRLIIR